MGVIDKLKNMMSGEIDDDEYMEYEDEVQEEDSLDISETINSAARNPRPQTKPYTGTGPQFVLVRPERFDDSISIADHVIAKKTVVLNLEGTGKDLARRIIDILSGTAYAVGAQIKNVSVGTYLIIPGGSEFSGEGLDRIESDSFML